MPSLERTTEMLSPASPPRQRSLPEGWHVPVCVMMSLGAHVLMTVCMPMASARELPPRERDLMFMSMSEVMVEAPAPVPTMAPPPELRPELPRPEAALPVPVATEPEPEPASAPEPSAPPPAAAEIMAATNVAAGGPAFTTGTAGGSIHGVGSTPTASETNPAATRPSTGTGVDVRGLMRGYMATLNGRVRPQVRYPRAAQIAGLEGIVRIGLLVDQHGNILRRRVQRSSGHPSLDAAALEGAERVASVPAPPADLRSAWASGPVELTVPIHMTLTR